MNSLSYIPARNTPGKSSTGFLNTTGKPGGDVYPFGMQMPGRMYNSDDYRYGFNGMEKDDEVKGSGNSYDFGARIQDPRLGRFMSPDPDEFLYPFQSTYAYAANNPILLLDKEGKGPTQGPFTGRVSKTKFGLRARRITTGDRVAMDVASSAMYAFGGPVGTAAGLAYETPSTAASEGTFEGTRHVAEHLSNDNVVGQNKNAFKSIGKGVGVLKHAYNAMMVSSEIFGGGTETREEVLEGATFNYATSLIKGADFNIVNKSLLDVHDKAANPDMLENALNTIYSVLDEELESFDLTSEEGQKKALEYLGKNQKEVISKIKNRYEKNLDSTSEESD